MTRILDVMLCLLELEFLAKVEKNPSFASPVIIKYSVYSETEMQGPALTPCLCC